MATGLKICFLPIAKIYFEAMAQTAAQPINIKYVTSEKDTGGFIISAKISAVMYSDSTFVGALNIVAKSKFTA